MSLCFRHGAFAEREDDLKTSVKYWLILALVSLFSVKGFCAQPSDREISQRLTEKKNKAIIEAFLKEELSEVNHYAAKPLLKSHPSLDFFIKQARRGPFESLLFLEEQVHKLRDAQENINSLPYVISFSSSEKEKILGLKEIAKKIISYGIPLMKRDFYFVLKAIHKLASIKGTDPIELVKDYKNRDEIYRMCAPTPEILSKEMGELSEGEEICIKLGWTLEQVTVTRLWLMVNDNSLPTPEDYKAFRKKRSEYFQRRLRRIYEK